MLTLDEARARVAVGAARMDATGEAWREGLDADALRMDHSCLCIMGQWRGRYHEGRIYLQAEHENLFPNNRVMVECGFVLDPDDYEAHHQRLSEVEADMDFDYRLLEQAWKELLA